MSVLHHESLLESCFDQVWEDFRVHNLLSPEQKGWDMQTYDNLVDNVCNAKETYLSENVRGI